MSRNVVVAAVVLGSACSGACSTPAGQAPMWRHFDAAGDAHEAVYRGDLGAAADAAERLENMRNPGLPVGAEALDIQMRVFAGQLRAATDLPEAAGAMARVVGTCGDCHRAFGPGPRFTGRGMPPGGGPEAAREMRRHSWAVNRMWEGLVGPSDSAWIAGANVLADAWMMPEWLAGEADAALIVRSMETAVRELGASASAIPTSDRPAVYAGILETCARCHQIVRLARGE